MAARTSRRGSPAESISDQGAHGVFAFERRLCLEAQRQRLQCDDAELAIILDRVHERRRLRRHDMPAPAKAVARPQVGHEVAGRAPGTVIDSKAVGETIRILQIAKPPGFTFLPGQYAKVGRPGGKRNDYSIASAPRDPYLELCIERIPSGRVSVQLTELQPGDRVEIGSAARGKFLLDPRADVHLMVATTTGIAPLRSMVRDALSRTRAARFVVLHGASHADELPYLQELQELAAQAPANLTYVPAVSRPEDPRNRGWTGRTGRIDSIAGEYIGGAELPRRGAQVYACGNSGMIASVAAQASAAGLPISAEAFD